MVPLCTGHPVGFRIKRNFVQSCSFCSWRRLQTLWQMNILMHARRHHAPNNKNKNEGISNTISRPVRYKSNKIDANSDCWIADSVADTCAHEHSYPRFHLKKNKALRIAHTPRTVVLTRFGCRRHKRYFQRLRRVRLDGARLFFLLRFLKWKHPVYRRIQRRIKKEKYRFAAYGGL